MARVKDWALEQAFNYEEDDWDEEDDWEDF